MVVGSRGSILQKIFCFEFVSRSHFQGSWLDLKEALSRVFLLWIYNWVMFPRIWPDLQESSADFLVFDEKFWRARDATYLKNGEVD